MKNTSFICLIIYAGCSALFFTIMLVLVINKNALTSTPVLNTQPLTTTTTSTTNQILPTDTKTYGAGSTFIDYIPSDAGNIAVRITVPATNRYSDGAPVLVYTPVFFTPEEQFEYNFNADSAGFVFLSPLYPGVTDQQSGVKSDGTFDYGGPLSVAAYRDVIKFASGDLADKDGLKITDRITTTIITDNVGLFAFSHPGLMSTNVMAYFGTELPHVHYVVNRESPTVDTMFPLELGHYAANGTADPNPLYNYSRDYSDTAINLDYSAVAWDQDEQAPYLDLNNNRRLDSADYEFGSQVPSMFGKHYYSQALTQALLDNGALTTTTWPSTLATPDETKRDWPYRQTIGHYSALTTLKNLHFMLVWSDHDHVLAVNDAPQIHQAFDNLTANNIWTRLNPDQAYVAALKPLSETIFHELSANTPVSDWSNAAAAGYSNEKIQTGIISLAAVTEMADRTHANNWTTNLSAILTSFTSTTTTTTKPTRPAKPVRHR